MGGMCPQNHFYFIHLTTELVWYSMAKIRKMHFLIDSLDDNKVNSIVISNYFPDKHILRH